MKGKPSSPTPRLLVFFFQYGSSQFSEWMNQAFARNRTLFSKGVQKQHSESPSPSRHDDHKKDGSGPSLQAGVKRQRLVENLDDDQEEMPAKNPKIARQHYPDVSNGEQRRKPIVSHSHPQSGNEDEDISIPIKKFNSYNLNKRETRSSTKQQSMASEG